MECKAAKNSNLQTAAVLALTCVWLLKPAVAFCRRITSLWQWRATRRSCHKQQTAGNQQAECDKFDDHPSNSLQHMVTTCEARWLLETMKEVLDSGTTKSVSKLQHMLEAGYGMKLSGEEAELWLQQAWALQTMRQCSVDDHTGKPQAGDRRHPEYSSAQVQVGRSEPFQSLDQVSFTQPDAFMVAEHAKKRQSEHQPCDSHKEMTCNAATVESVHERHMHHAKDRKEHSEGRVHSRPEGVVARHNEHHHAPQTEFVTQHSTQHVHGHHDRAAVESMSDTSQDCDGQVSSTDVDDACELASVCDVLSVIGWDDFDEPPPDDPDDSDCDDHVR